MTLQQLQRLAQKHPHLRGEDDEKQHFNYMKIEIPPPAWGRLTGVTVEGTASRKHPHLRGEDKT